MKWRQIIKEKKGKIRTSPQEKNHADKANTAFARKEESKDEGKERRQRVS